MGLRNLPTDKAQPVAGLIQNRPGQVSSMGLSTDGRIDFMLMAFSAGESVSEEEYFGDTLYHVVEGAADIVLPDRREPVSAGEAFMVPAHIPHAVEGHDGGAFKLLQLTVPEERK